ncbi:hypothetical protein [Simiduia aestuariiviva]|uniref:Uncharacterized protein n=1 Tax=Simiduia aestuariiviva TaxID=1510459 RepID=A0A839UNX5_9GAMM|nr:hypothetical protein [Simiduia aestuariiviva]MBB3169453.1 hypothetical protein [Simiduia aestuariiviva]
MDIFFGVSFLFWPLILGLIARKITCVPKALLATLVRGYIALFISLLISVSFVFLYYQPLIECLSTLSEPIWSKCSALPSAPIEWFGEWNFATTSAIGISSVMYWLFKQNQFNKALKTDAQTARAV